MRYNDDCPAICDMGKQPVYFSFPILLGSVNLLNQLVNCIGNISHAVYQGKMRGVFCHMLQDRASTLGLQAYEDTKQLDRLEQAKKGMRQLLLSDDPLYAFFG